jgi:hypothetical protein
MVESKLWLRSIEITHVALRISYSKSLGLHN